MKRKLFLLGFGIAFILIGVCFAIVGFAVSDYVWIPSCSTRGGRWGLPEYWRGKGVAEPWDSAPNGWYHVQAGWESKDGEVYFPLCPSCGSRLHGIWQTQVYLPEGFEGEVRLESNVIVEIRR